MYTSRRHDALELDPRRCVAVEDSRNGLRAAAAAGMAVIAVPNEHYPPDAEALRLAAAVVAIPGEITPELVRAELARSPSRVNAGMTVSHSAGVVQIWAEQCPVAGPSRSEAARWMPERIEQRRAADLLERRVLLALSDSSTAARLSASCSSVRAPTIRLVTPGPRDQPRQRDRAGRHAVRLGNLDEHLDGVVQLVLVVDRRLAPLARVPRAAGRSRPRRYLPDSQPPASGLQIRRPKSLIDRRGDDLELCRPLLQ